MGNLTLRFFFGGLLLLIALYAIMYNQALITLIIIMIGAGMLSEWYSMTKNSKFFTYLGLLIIPTSITSLLLISEIDKSGDILLTYLFVIATVDTMAMIGGKTLKGPKLAKKISPNKTISGFIVGVTSAGLVPYLISLFYPSYNLASMLQESNIRLSVYCILLAACAQCSDLFISIFKRRFGLKDTGNIIPGHGGVLDRFDGVVLTAPIVLAYLIH